MTDGLNLPTSLTVKPSCVAGAIYKAVESRKDTIYIKSVWRIIMVVIRNIPEKLFKFMNI